MDWERDWQGKRVYLALKGGRKFTGNIILVSREANGDIWLKISDKYDKEVAINVNQVEFLQEEEDRE